MGQNRAKKQEEWFGWMFALLGVMILGLISIMVYASTTNGNGRAIGSFGFLLAGGCLLLGSLVGFLFGIPRSLQHEHNTSTSDARDALDTTGRYRPNTNLEQISDWLTKILVGVGLTQLGDIPEYLDDGATYLAKALGNNEYSTPIGLWIIIYFSSCGFLFGYLWTRLFLSRALAESEVNALVTAQVLKVQNDQSQVDAAALSLTYRYLRPDTKPEDFDIDELKNKIKAASAPVKVQIFYLAENVRSENWKDNKPLMERTLPIFQALVEADAEQEFHRNFAQLGFVLKDKITPDYRAAEEALTAAIRIRRASERGDWLIYEANRAICLIEQDPQFVLGKEADPETKKKIMADLSVAYEDEFCRTHIFNGETRSPRLGDWIKLNKVEDKFP